MGLRSRAGFPGANVDFSDGQAERDRLGDAVDDEPSAAWLSSLRFG
jgi:hypothetical protein